MILWRNRAMSFWNADWLAPDAARSFSGLNASPGPSSPAGTRCEASSLSAVGELLPDAIGSSPTRKASGCLMEKAAMISLSRGFSTPLAARAMASANCAALADRRDDVRHHQPASNGLFASDQYQL